MAIPGAVIAPFTVFQAIAERLVAEIVVVDSGNVVNASAITFPACIVVVTAADVASNVTSARLATKVTCPVIVAALIVTAVAKGADILIAPRAAIP